MAINKRQSFRNCEVHFELKFNFLLKERQSDYTNA